MAGSAVVDGRRLEARSAGAALALRARIGRAAGEGAHCAITVLGFEARRTGCAHGGVSTAADAVCVCASSACAAAQAESRRASCASGVAASRAFAAKGGAGCKKKEKMMNVNGKKYHI